MSLRCKESGVLRSSPFSGVQGRKLAIAISVLLHGGALLLVGSVIISTRPAASPESFKAVLEDSFDSVMEEEAPEVAGEPEEELSEADGGSGEGSPAPALAVDEWVALDSGAMSPSTFVLPPTTGGLFSNVFGVAGGTGTGGSGNGKGSGRLKSSQIFGVDLATGNEGLIVYLDHSGSMQEASKRVRALVTAEYPQAMVFHLRGALFAEDRSIDKLKKERKGEDYIVTYYRTMLNSSIIPKCCAYLDTLGTPPEAIYMMSDFKDYVDPQVVDDFSRLLVSKKIKFFAHSVGERPHAAISTLCRQTGGAVLMVPLEKLPKAPEEGLESVAFTP